MGDIEARSVDGSTTFLSESAVEDFRGSHRGVVLREGEAGYDERRSVWNARIDRRPALIARCLGVADVMRSVELARAHSLPIAVRGGGHNIGGSAVCDEGLMLDLSLMKGIRVDPEARTVWAEPGVTWGEFDRETQAFGLATTGGTCSLTGIAGVTLGGGEGWLMRKYGLSLDNLLSLDVVTADGHFRKVSATENAELFSSVRGAHSNFGVVTGLEYRLHVVGPTVLAGMVLHPLDRGGDVLRFYRDFTRGSPHALGVWAGLMTTPDGHPVVAIVALHAGEIEEAETAMAPLKAFGTPLADLIQPMPYVQAQKFFDDAYPEGRFNYWKSSLLETLSDATLDACIEAFRNVDSPYSSVLFTQLGGAVAKVGAEETAFGTRRALYDFLVMPAWTVPSESEKHIAWADELWQAVQPDASGGVYVNYLGSNEGRERVRAAYGDNYARLATVKAKYDPSNLFSVNQNVEPEG